MSRGCTRVPAKLYAFHGEMRTAKEIAKALGASKAIVYVRAKTGKPLEDPVDDTRRGYGKRGALLQSGVHEIGASNGENGLYWADDLEARVWHLYCGGDEFGECTLAEIAALWGVSRERIRQVQDEAFRKIRRLVAKGDPDALAAVEYFRQLSERRSRQKPGAWEQAEANAPGNFELTTFNETVSNADIAKKFGDDEYASRPCVMAGKRGARATRRRGRAA